MVAHNWNPSTEKVETWEADTDKSLLANSLNDIDEWTNSRLGRDPASKNKEDDRLRKDSQGAYMHVHAHTHTHERKRENRRERKKIDR